MLRHTGFILFSVLAACTLPGHVSAETPLAERPALDFSEKITTSGMGENTAFARSVARRYGNGLTQDSILADVKAQGFSCDADGASCTRSATDGVCADAWMVDFDESGAASGRHVKRCMGALEDDE